VTPDEIIKGAIEVLETEGHTKNGRYYQHGEGYCALGAMGVAAGVFREEKGVTDCMASFFRVVECTEAANRVARAAGLGDYAFIPDWNDDEASAEDVILAMKRALNDRSGS
jgi:hypothetical protein